MQCEICGNAAGKGTKILMDGIEMIACEECSHFGKQKEKTESEKSFAMNPAKKIYSEKQSVFEQLLLIENYGAAIKRAREKKQLTFDELSKIAGEKASSLRSIESEHYSPSMESAKRIEKALGIKIIETTKAQSE